MIAHPETLLFGPNALIPDKVGNNNKQHKSLSSPDKGSVSSPVLASWAAALVRQTQTIEIEFHARLV